MSPISQLEYAPGGQISLHPQGQSHRAQHSHMQIDLISDTLDRHTVDEVPRALVEGAA